MNYSFYRKRAFFIIEKLDSEIATKNALLQKFQDILKNYLNLKKTILSSNEIDKNFAQSTLYVLDLNIKKLEGLIFLTSNDDAEWKILISFIENEKNKFINASNNCDYFILNIDKVGDFKKKFFYILKKYGIIDSEQFKLINQIKNCRDNISLPHLNDYYFDHKNNILKNVTNGNSDHEMIAFCDKKLYFRKFDSLFWNFIQKIVAENNDYLILIISLLKKNNYDLKKIYHDLNKILNSDIEYKQIYEINDIIWEKQKELKEFLLIFQNVLDKVNNKVGMIHFYFEQFSLAENNKINPLIKHLFIYFLMSESPHHELNNACHKRRALHEIFLHAEYHLDLIYILLQKQINFEKNAFPKLINNFKNLNEIELSVFKKVKLIKQLRNSDYESYQTLVYKIKRIIYHKNYRTQFDQYLHSYFNNLNMIGLPSYWKILHNDNQNNKNEQN